MLLVAVPEVIIALSAKLRASPGKTAHHAIFDAIPVHSLEEALQTGHTSFFVPVEEPKAFFFAAEGATLFLNFLGEKMGMGVNDHGPSNSLRGDKILPVSA
jgi:hypothetical protein